MSLDLDDAVAICLREVRPRVGFAGELLAALIQDPPLIQVVDDTLQRQRSRWLVAGAVAGVVTATGAVYVAARRQHGRAA